MLEDCEKGVSPTYAAYPVEAELVGPKSINGRSQVRNIGRTNRFEQNQQLFIIYEDPCSFGSAAHFTLGGSIAMGLGRNKNRLQCKNISYRVVLPYG